MIMMRADEIGKTVARGEREREREREECARKTSPSSSSSFLSTYRVHFEKVDRRLPSGQVGVYS